MNSKASDVSEGDVERVAAAIAAVQGGMNYDYADFCRDAARAAIATLSPPLPSLEVERLREALEPFASMAVDYDAPAERLGAPSPYGDERTVRVRLGDCRRARAALSALPLDGGL